MTWWLQLPAKWPDLIINFLGVFAGAAFAWRMTIWQLEKQSQESDQRDRELTVAYLDRLKLELRQNEGVAQQLRDIMAKCQNAREDLLELAKAVADATAATIYSDFVSKGLHRRLKANEEQALHAAYAMSIDLKVMAD